VILCEGRAVIYKYEISKDGHPSVKQLNLLEIVNFTFLHQKLPVGFKVANGAIVLCHPLQIMMEKE
jgi:hypothetical protein